MNLCPLDIQGLGLFLWYRGILYLANSSPSFIPYMIYKLPIFVCQYLPDTYKKSIEIDQRVPLILLPVALYVFLTSSVIIALKACVSGSTLQILTQMLRLCRQLPADYFCSINADHTSLHCVAVQD